MKPEVEAENLLEELGINCFPIQAYKIIDDLQISRIERPFTSIEGCFIFDPCGQKTFISVNSKIREKGRKNFTYAHELGHMCLDAFSKIVNSCQKDDIYIIRTKTINQCEINANTFASHLLLPDFLIKDNIKNFDPCWKKISEMAEQTETSLITMASRFVELNQNICLLAVIFQNKVIKYFRKSQNWNLYFDMNSRIVTPSTYAYKACNQENIPDDFQSVPADTWLSDKRIPHDAEILEWSLPLNSYGSVLTLLWDNKNLLEEFEDEEDYYNDNNKIGGVWSPPNF